MKGMKCQVVLSHIVFKVGEKSVLGKKLTRLATVVNDSLIGQPFTLQRNTRWNALAICSPESTVPSFRLVSTR